ncbi:E1 ubiquitin-activating protein uba2 [Ascosphaera pollenicola]|nr:E1 ubiquitin-activating protein uba2 [Ascosphaera pollenicola]
MANDTAANVLATIGTVCWCVQLIPQIIHNFRHKSTEGLPGAMMFIWALSALPFGVYFLLLDESVPLEVQPQLFGTLSVITNFSLKKVLICGTGLAAVLGGLEALFVLVIRHPQNDRGITWPRLLFGVLATVLFAVGFIPTFLELWRSQGRVIGIDFIFLSIDMSGALFSLISLAFEGSFDVLGGVLYIVMYAFPLFPVLLQGGWNLLLT